MQKTPLLVSAILEYAKVAHGSREIVSRCVDEPIWRYDWKRFADRAEKLGCALVRMGIAPGDRITTLAWNNHRHMELMYAVPSIGAVLHTANPRMADDQLLHTINHAGGRILFFDRNLLPLVQRLRPFMVTIESFVMLCDEDGATSGQQTVVAYEGLLSAETGAFRWPALDENAGAIICYTSGTTGNPKGVLYSHRSITLHALAAGLSGSMNLSAFDAVMPASSLYHANGWGMPFAAAMNGCKVVLPCDRMDGASLHELISAEGVTMSAGVPTIWNSYLAHLEATGSDTGPLQRVLVGGSALSTAMVDAFNAHGVRAVHALGMTETSPLIVVATPTPGLLAQGAEHAAQVLATRQGRPMFGIELSIRDEQGLDLPWDGESSGSLLLRGPWVVDRYFPDVPATDDDGWFDTGDIATIDATGFLRVTDRKKDVIKSGGEWISSIELENTAMGCPGVRIAAVVGVHHPHWEERPLMVVETLPDAEVNAEQVRAYLEPRVPRWWLPDAIVIAQVPLTGIGKIDKVALRARYHDHLRDTN